MRKDEFLQILRRALNGDVPPSVVEENIRYYDSYITEEVRKGRTEEEVIGEIGDPRLIARTIEDTTDGAGDGRYRNTETYYEDRRGQDDIFQGRDRTEDTNSYDQNPYWSGSHMHVFNLNKWYWKLLAAVIVFAVIYLVIAVIGGIFTLLMPLLGPIILIWLIITVIRSMTRR